MGFGLLFVGYFMATLMSINMFGWLFRLLGYGIVYIATGKLGRYNTKFIYAGFGAIFMMLVAAAMGVSDVSGYLYDEMILAERLLPEAFDSVIEYVYLAGDLIFNGLLLFAIRAIAEETEVEKIKYNAVRNFIFLCFYYLLFTIGRLPFEGLEQYVKTFSLPTLLLQLVSVILNLILIFTCYAKICDSSDVEMEQKPSRFAFVNRFREESEQRRAAAEERRRAAEREKKRGRK